MKPIFLFILIIAVFEVNTFAQDCKVLKSEIAAKYTGDCKKGLANGKGIAEGTDKYEGKFKEGLPHGFGIYKYANGDIYDGEFKNGLREGNGKFTFKHNGKDSTFNGIWNGDKLVKKVVPAAYSVSQKTNVQRYTVQKVGSGNRVMFSFMQNGMNNRALSGLSFAENSGTSFTMGLDQGFDSVQFPFTCKITYSTQNSLRTASYDVVFEIQINEPGQWLVTLYN